MAWIGKVRERAQTRLTAAREAAGPPPFREDRFGGDGRSVVLVERAPSVDDGIPAGLRIAAAWAWRLILLVAGAYVLIRLVGLLSLIVIPVAVALLLAALLQPAAAALRDRGMNKSVAAALVLIAGLVFVIGGIGLIVQTFIAQFDDLAEQVREGIGEVQTWLAEGPLNLSQAQVTGGLEDLQQWLAENQGTLTSGAWSTATTFGEFLAGFFLVLFILYFFLRDGDPIWRFLCRLLPRPAQVPVARAGHYSWYTLVNYVRATVLVAFVDALGIGIGLVVLDVPLALPLAALVFLGAFVPVIGATLSGAVAILVALVAQGPVSALIVLAIVIGVQQLEGNVLQPLIMGRAVSLHPLAVVLAITAGVVVAGIVGGVVAVPLLAVVNTAVRYLVRHPSGEPTPEGTPPGTEPADDELAEAAEQRREAAERADPADPPPVETSVEPMGAPGGEPARP